MWMFAGFELAMILTDLKMRQCRSCESIIVYEYTKVYDNFYCVECYRARNGGYDN